MHFFRYRLTSAIPDTSALSAPVAFQAPTMSGHLSNPSAAASQADQPRIGLHPVHRIPQVSQDPSDFVVSQGRSTLI